jgi:hypothetical protein
MQGAHFTRSFSAQTALAPRSKSKVAFAKVDVCFPAIKIIRHLRRWE